MRVPARRLVWAALAVGLVTACAAAAIALWPRSAARKPAPESVPAAWAQFRASPGHQTHVGKADIACGACHDFERDGFKNPGTAVCGNCHAKEAAVGHRGGIGLTATPCLSCHAFAPDVPKPTCIGCHAKPQGESHAVVRHATLECAQCHKVHESPSVVVANCASCHVERAPEHAGHAGSAGCLDCHRGHDPAMAALDTCTTCHVQPPGSPPRGHESCVGCHQPHDFVAGGETACVRCHGEKITLAAETAPAHAVCTSCHMPHAPGNAAAACVGCHANVHVAHGNEGACVSCHQPHTDNPRLLTSTCTSCHAKVAGVDTGAHAGGIACEGCHKPHAFAPLDEKTLCTSCHARETALVAANPGHQACASCHGASVAHAPTKAPACGTCHAKEQASAPAGHQRCEECHDPHAGEPTPTCAACHKSETTGIHAAVVGGCATCHRPHGPEGIAAAPSCTSCHALATLPALHAVPGHAVCNSCHVAPHEPPRADRVTCTSTCHTDKRDHQPKATVCTGCHVFRR